MTRHDEILGRLSEIAMFFGYCLPLAWIPWLLFIRGGRKGVVGGVFPLLLGLSIGVLQTDGTKRKMLNHSFQLGWWGFICWGMYYSLVQRNAVIKLIGFLLLAALGWAMPWTYWYSMLDAQLDKDERSGMPGDSLRAYARRVGII